VTSENGVEGRGIHPLKITKVGQPQVGSAKAGQPPKATRLGFRIESELHDLQF